MWGNLDLRLRVRRMFHKTSSQAPDPTHKRPQVPASQCSRSEGRRETEKDGATHTAIAFVPYPPQGLPPHSRESPGGGAEGPPRTDALPDGTRKAQKECADGRHGKRRGRDSSAVMTVLPVDVKREKNEGWNEETGFWCPPTRQMDGGRLQGRLLGTGENEEGTCHLGLSELRESCPTRQLLPVFCLFTGSEMPSAVPYASRASRKFHFFFQSSQLLRGASVTSVELGPALGFSLSPVNSALSHPSDRNLTVSGHRGRSAAVTPWTEGLSPVHAPRQTRPLSKCQ